MSYNLNRITIFNNQKNFPKTIIKALVHTCGVSVSDSQVEKREKEILEYIKNYERIIDENFDKIENNDGLLKIAEFIGDQKSWKNKETLIQALKNIIIFNKNQNIEDCLKEDKLIISWKTNDNINSCDPIMAYKYCLAKNIHIENSDNISDIENKINKFLNIEKENKQIEIELSDIKLDKIELTEQRFSEIELPEIKDSKLEEYKYEIERKNYELEKYKSELEKYKEGNEERNNELEKYKNELEKYKEGNNDIEKYKDEIKQKTYELEKYKNEIGQKTYEIEKYKEGNNDIEKYKDEIKQKTYELEKYKDEYMQKTNELEKYKDELEKYKDEYMQKTNELEKYKDGKGENINLNEKLFSHRQIKTFLNSKPKEINLEGLKKFLKQSIVNLLSAKTLLSNEEAIYLGLRAFSFDLRESINPHEDLLELNENIKKDISFIPDKDKEDLFSRNLNLNKNYYSLSHYYFKELKPFYTPKMLNELYEEYSIENKNINNLEEYFNKENFYRGWLSGDEKSYFGKNFKFVSQKDILSLGIIKSQIISFEIEELTEFFKSRGNKNPITNKYLEVYQINSIKNICHKFKDYNKYQELLLSLNKKELKDSKDINFFTNKYLFASELIDKILDDIMKIGFYIRGWKLTLDIVYPLRKKDCIDYNEKKDKINTNIEKVLTELNYRIEKIADKSIKNVLKRLPVVNYIVEDFVYDDKNETVNDLIVSLEDLEKVDINRISNKFILFSYYYSLITSNKKKFHISEFENI